MIPAAKLYKCVVFPVELQTDGRGKSLVVAMTDPTNLFLVDDLQFMAGCRVVPVVAAEADIMSALNRYFPGGRPVSPAKARPEPALSHQSILNYGEEDRLERLIALLQAKGLLSQREVDRLK